MMMVTTVLIVVMMLYRLPPASVRFLSRQTPFRVSIVADMPFRFRSSMPASSGRPWNVLRFRDPPLRVGR
jgi:hypothetical protein